MHLLRFVFFNMPPQICNLNKQISSCISQVPAPGPPGPLPRNTLAGSYILAAAYQKCGPQCARRQTRCLRGRSAGDFALCQKPSHDPVAENVVYVRKWHSNSYGRIHFDGVTRNPYECSLPYPCGMDRRISKTDWNCSGGNNTRKARCRTALP